MGMPAMTNLTEQWKNRELQGGWYFVEFENGSILPVFYCGFNREFEFNWDWKISKVLSRCSYEEFDNVTKCYLSAHKRAKKLDKQNQQLKELLKQWVHFYPIVLYEYEDTLKTKDIIELYEKTINAIGEKK